ncbi:hypothetical protein IPJ72_06865 [Candidatus Peregrinibacteria bacterium]|nr:MAG: hypothetical protein IPJ72_06865 [Candidatus Peregrinibacteria bacterium]
MFNLGDDIVMIGSTDLRDKMPKIKQSIKKNKVIVAERGTPFAVLSDFDEYNQKEEIIDTFGDIVLGYLAKERAEKSSEKDYVDSETVEKSIGL